MNADDRLHGQPRPTPEQVAWVFHHLNEHYGEGGSFRQLIYERMGLRSIRFRCALRTGHEPFKPRELHPR
jgi:hypothetical protein